MSKSQFLRRLSSKLEVFVKYSTNITLPRLEITFLGSFKWGKLQISVQFVSKHCCCETKFTKNHAPTTRITLFLELRWISKRWCKSFFRVLRVFFMLTERSCVGAEGGGGAWACERSMAAYSLLPLYAPMAGRGFGVSCMLLVRCGFIGAAGSRRRVFVFARFVCSSMARRGQSVGTVREVCRVGRGLRADRVQGAPL